VKIAQSMNYRNAGTIEFLLDENGKFYFLEMNTRIQVEHPVTEMITNSDLVSLQLLVAAGNQLPVEQKDIRISGHSIEVRLCAEDAENNFKPSAGKIALWQIPEMGNLRIETYVKEGITVSPNYDSLLGKLIVWGESRSAALKKNQQILSETAISGIHTNLSFLSGLLESESVQKNAIYTRYIDENLEDINRKIQEKKGNLKKEYLAIAYLVFHFQKKNKSGNSIWNQLGFWRMMPQVEVIVDGERYNCSVNSDYFSINQQNFQVSAVEVNKNLVKFKIDQQSILNYCTDIENETIVFCQGYSFSVKSNLILKQASVIRKNTGNEKIFQNLICADLFGKVLKFNVSEGDVVQSGQILLTLESMKTEIHVLCPVNARIRKIHVKEGNAVNEKQLLVELEEYLPVTSS